MAAWRTRVIDPSWRKGNDEMACNCRISEPFERCSGGDKVSGEGITVGTMCIMPWHPKLNRSHVALQLPPSSIYRVTGLVAISCELWHMCTSPIGEHIPALPMCKCVHVHSRACVCACTFVCECVGMRACAHASVCACVNVCVLLSGQSIKIGICFRRCRFF